MTINLTLTLPVQPLAERPAALHERLATLSNDDSAATWHLDHLPASQHWLLTPAGEFPDRCYAVSLKVLALLIAAQIEAHEAANPIPTPAVAA